MPVYKIKICVCFEKPARIPGGIRFLKDKSKYFEATFTDRITYKALRSQIQNECTNLLPLKWGFDDGGVRLGYLRIEDRDAMPMKHISEFTQDSIVPNEELEAFDVAAYSWMTLCVVVEEIK